jgi:hypothetical protein
MCDALNLPVLEWVRFVKRKLVERINPSHSEANWLRTDWKRKIAKVYVGVLFTSIRDESDYYLY